MKKSKAKKKIGKFSYETDNILGTGTFGKVYRAINLETKEDSAVKVFPKEKGLYSVIQS